MYINISIYIYEEKKICNILSIKLHIFSYLDINFVIYLVIYLSR